MIIPKKISSHNFRAFLWHAVFLALAQNFMDVDTVIPAMLIDSGGNAFHIGLMTAIMMGGSSFSQLIFAPFISNRSLKKPILLAGINTRILSLLALGIILFSVKNNQSQLILALIFLFITAFSLSGAFANIAYMDILGKSIHADKRKTFFSSRQIISGVAVILSAFVAKHIISFKTFPINYAYLFFIGGTLLLIASAGFWRLKEGGASEFKIGSIVGFLQILKAEIRKNKKLVYFLGFINTQGIAISFMPFIVLHAKQSLFAENTETGYFLLFKVFGVVMVSLLVLIFSSKIRYNLILYLNLFFSVLLAALVLLISDLHLLRYIFILGGIVFSLYNISMNGVLLEVSGNRNRAIYAGFAGTGNILPAVFPLLGGWVIGQWDFRVFVIIFIILVSLSLVFIRKMNCQK